MDKKIFYRENPIHMNGETNMFVVHFFENKIELLNQLLENVPAVGDSVIIKGHKGKVMGVNNVDEKHVHVQIAIEKVVSKNKLTAADLAKKKKR
jgi:hypothetical protein